MQCLLTKQKTTNRLFYHVNGFLVERKNRNNQIVENNVFFVNMVTIQIGLKEYRFRSFRCKRSRQWVKKQMSYVLFFCSKKAYQVSKVEKKATFYKINDL